MFLIAGMLPLGLAVLVVGSPTLRPWITRSRRWLIDVVSRLYRRIRGYNKNFTKSASKHSTRG